MLQSIVVLHPVVPLNIFGSRLVQRCHISITVTLMGHHGNLLFSFDFLHSTTPNPREHSIEGRKVIVVGSELAVLTSDDMLVKQINQLPRYRI